jgi:ABC-type bacteriocin/lantibiotic exporter with double-glycine peptidase domain
MIKRIIHVLGPWLGWSILILPLIGLASCHSPIGMSYHENGLMATGRYDLISGIDLPKVDGVAGCGAQALAAVMAFEDDILNADSLAEELPWHEVGATPVDLLLEARARGFEATIARGDLEILAKSARQGQPVIIMIDAGYEVRWFFARHDLPKVMHWAVVSGVARDESQILLAAKDGRHHKVEREDFERRWGRSDHCQIVIHRAD